MTEEVEVLTVAWSTDCAATETTDLVRFAAMAAEQWWPLGGFSVRVGSWKVESEDPQNRSVNHLAFNADAVCIVLETDAQIGPNCLELLVAAMGYFRRPIILAPSGLPPEVMIQLESAEATAGEDYDVRYYGESGLSATLSEVLIESAARLLRDGR